MRRILPLLLLASLCPPAPAADRPNILFALADDWSWPHAGVYGDKVVHTPTFDRVAREGVLFTNTFCVAPTCTPSRASMLTGQTIHRLAEGGNLWGILPARFTCYPDLLEAAGYQVGYTRKGWDPGSLEGSGRTRNPAGPRYPNFAQFLKSVPAGKPFCFWFGSHDPHRPYVRGSGLHSGMRLEDVVVPPYLPDTPEVRGDLLDYYFAVQRFDRDVGDLLQMLKERGLEENTLVVMTGDNGLPFPRAKANLYDAGCHLPLAVRWPAKVKGGRVVDDLVSFTDFAPTYLEAAGLPIPADMTGRSFLGLLTGDKAGGRDKVFLARERHANVRRGDASYPARAVRTKDFLYVRNLRPDRWPAGDPETWQAVGPFGDIDPGPSKSVLMTRRDDPAIRRFFELACAKRPAEELYDLRRDPWELVNVAGRPEYAADQDRLRAELDRWRRDTGDPRLTHDDDRWDHYRYFGQPAR